MTERRPRGREQGASPGGPPGYRSQARPTLGSLAGGQADRLQRRRAIERKRPGQCVADSTRTETETAAVSGRRVSGDRDGAGQLLRKSLARAEPAGAGRRRTPQPRRPTPAALDQIRTEEWPTIRARWPPCCRSRPMARTRPTWSPSPVPGLQARADARAGHRHDGHGLAGALLEDAGHDRPGPGQPC